MAGLIFKALILVLFIAVEAVLARELAHDGVPPDRKAGSERFRDEFATADLNLLVVVATLEVPAAALVAPVQALVETSFLSDVNAQCRSTVRVGVASGPASHGCGLAFADVSNSL